MTATAPSVVTGPAILRPGWRLHVVLGVVLVAGFLILQGPSASFTSDDGAYAYQVSELLDGGGWVVEDPIAGLDRSTRPLINSIDTEEGQIPYGRHPAVVMIAVAVGSLLGLTAGLWFLPLVGLVGAAAAGHRLADYLHPGSGPAGFWLVLAGPLLVNGASFWAHAPSAAAAGWLVVIGLEAIDRGASPGRLTLIASLAAALPLLRSEGLLFVAALALAALVLARRQGVVFAGLSGVVALAAAVVERRWVLDLTGVPQATGVRGGSSDLVASRVEGSWHSLLDPSFVDSSSGVLLLVALLLVGGAVLRIRASQPTEARWLLVAASVVWLVWAVAGPRDLATGLVVVWPALFLGGSAVVDRSRADHIVGLTVFAFFGAVVATQYADGGGAQWGGRFFSPAFVLLAALCAPAVAELITQADLRWAVIAVVVVPTLAGAVATSRFRSLHDDVVAEASASEAPIVITEVRALPRLAWTTHPDARWLIVAPADLESTVDAAQAAGYQRVAVHGYVDVPLVGSVESVSPALRVVHTSP